MNVHAVDVSGSSASNIHNIHDMNVHAVDVSGSSDSNIHNIHDMKVHIVDVSGSNDNNIHNIHDMNVHAVDVSGSSDSNIHNIHDMKVHIVDVSGSSDSIIHNIHDMNVHAVDVSGSSDSIIHNIHDMNVYTVNEWGNLSNIGNTYNVNLHTVDIENNIVHEVNVIHKQKRGTGSDNGVITPTVEGYLEDAEHSSTDEPEGLVKGTISSNTRESIWSLAKAARDPYRQVQWHQERTTSDEAILVNTLQHLLEVDHGDGPGIEEGRQQKPGFYRHQAFLRRPTDPTCSSGSADRLWSGTECNGQPTSESVKDDGDKASYNKKCIRSGRDSEHNRQVQGLSSYRGGSNTTTRAEGRKRGQERSASGDGVPGIR